MGQTSENLELFYDAGREGRCFGVRYHKGADVRVCPHKLFPKQMRLLVKGTRSKPKLLEGYLSLHHPAMLAWVKGLPPHPDFDPVAMLSDSFGAFSAAFAALD